MERQTWTSVRLVHDRIDPVQVQARVTSLHLLSIVNIKLHHTASFQSQDGAKRLKLSDDCTAASAPATNMTKLGGIRRSTRHRKLRGEKALIVSANQTLKELKIQVSAGVDWIPA